MSMLKGERVSLRLVREADLDMLFDFHQDLGNRGGYIPLGVMAEPVFRQRFASTGFWEKEEGMLLMVDRDGRVVGHIEFFYTVPYLDELELSYHVYSPEDAGKGYTTEAVMLLVGYLFGRMKHNRIRLIIHPDNGASRRVAEKCGFVHEGTARGAWYHNGRHHDVEVYAILKDEFEALGMLRLE